MSFARLKSSAAVLACLLALARVAVAAPPVDPPLPPNLDESIGRGLDFLAAQQGPDGALAKDGPRLAVTGLGLLSFLGCGHTPDVGKYGDAVRRAEDFLISQAQSDGYFGKVDASRMYGQGIVTLALAEAWGVEPREERRRKIREVVGKAAELILQAQAVNKPPPYAGGWRYEPQAPDSDLSLSGWNALALRACRDAGLAVPKEAVQKAVEFVLKCHPAQSGFGYQPGTPALVSSTGAGVLCLYLLGGLDHADEITAGVKFLLEHPFDEGGRFVYYSMYYATQAAFQAGDAAWAKVSGPVFDRLLKTQVADGGWPPSPSGEEPGRVYSTSMALLTLSVPNRILPIYQR